MVLIRLRGNVGSGPLSDIGSFLEPITRGVPSKDTLLQIVVDDVQA